MEGELSREVVHPTRVHQTQRVSHGLGAQHALARDWTDSTVSQGGRHHAGALTGHFDGAELFVDKNNREVTDVSFSSACQSTVRPTVRALQ